MTSKRTIFQRMGDEARQKGYGKDKPSLHEIEKQWRYYIPPQVVKDKYGSGEGQNAFSYVLYGNIFPRLYADKANWIMQDEFGVSISPEDFASSLLSGYIPAKNTIGKSSALGAINTYSPRPIIPGSQETDNSIQSREIDGVSQYVCPRCKSSFWAEIAGGPGPNPIVISHHPETDIRKQKSCGGGKHQVDPGDYPMTSSDGKIYDSVVDDPFVKSENNNYYRYCGYPFNIKPFYSELYSRMKSVRTEDRRYRYAPTMGRRPAGTVRVYTCEHCAHPNYDYYENVEDPAAKSKAKELTLEERFPYSFQARKEVPCENCGKMINTENPVHTVVYANVPLVTLDKPISTGEGEGGALKDILHRTEVEALEPKILKERLWGEIISLLHDHFDSKGQGTSVDAFQDYFGIGQDVEHTLNIEKLLSTSPDHNWCLDKAPRVGCREISEKYFNLRGHYTECLDCGNEMNEEATKEKFENDKRRAGIPVEDLTRGAITRCTEVHVGPRRNLKHSLPQEVVQELAQEVAKRKSQVGQTQGTLIRVRGFARKKVFQQLFDDDFEEVEVSPFETPIAKETITTEEIAKRKEEEELAYIKEHGRIELTQEEATVLEELSRTDSRYLELWKRYDGRNLRYHGKLDNDNEDMVAYNGGKMITPYIYQPANTALKRVTRYLTNEAKRKDSEIGELLQEILSIEEESKYTV